MEIDMKRVLVLAVIALGATGLFADNHEEFEKSMKAAGATFGPLNKSIAAGAFDDVAAGAKKMEAVFATSEKFWTERGTADAIQWSKDGGAAAKALSAAAAAKDADAAKAAFGKAAATCKGCHAAHREKLEDGTYKIK
jgi:cytochrome c556